MFKKNEDFPQRLNNQKGDMGDGDWHPLFYVRKALLLFPPP